MTKQEMFDTVATHLFSQGKQALYGDGTCAYRGDEGTKCAIGCLIPDDVYTEDMEGRGIAENLSEDWDFPVLRRLFNTQHKQELAFDLQAVHDQADPFTEKYIRQRMEVVAKAHGLSDAILRTLHIRVT